jgi:hypothetical protein
LERGKVPRQAGFGMISAVEAISLARDLPIAEPQDRAEEAGLSNIPAPFAGRFLSAVTQTTRYRLTDIFYLAPAFRRDRSARDAQI